MPADQTCPTTAVARSACVLRTILEDVEATYPGAGGGGITSIRLATTTSYVVSISQEERVDLLTYEFEISDDGKVTILSREIGAKTYD